MAKLEFEKPVLELEAKIAELRNVGNDTSINIAEEIQRMQNKAEKLLVQTYGKLTAQQKVLVARHQERPHFSNYVQDMIEDFTPLAGDRNFADDNALLGGLGRFRGQKAVSNTILAWHGRKATAKHNA